MSECEMNSSRSATAKTTYVFARAALVGGVDDIRKLHLLPVVLKLRGCKERYSEPMPSTIEGLEKQAGQTRLVALHLVRHELDALERARNAVRHRLRARDTP